MVVVARQSTKSDAILPQLRAVLFDVFGTVVDWRSSIARQLRDYGARTGLTADWDAIADAWRREYQPAMDEVRSGRRAWTVLDTLHRESLDRVLGANGLDVVPAADRDELTLAWHRLDPWPDAVDGITRLRGRFTVGTLSNGNTSLLADLAAYADLPWDILLGAESARTYKPLPDAYLRNVAHLRLSPGEVMLVAAHNSDLHAAAACGLRTGFVRRLSEHGPDQLTDLDPTGDWDVVADSIVEIAEAMTG